MLFVVHILFRQANLMLLDDFNIARLDLAMCVSLVKNLLLVAIVFCYTLYTFNYLLLSKTIFEMLFLGI